MKLLKLTFERHTISIRLNDNDFINRWLTDLQQYIDNKNYSYQITLNGFVGKDSFKQLRLIIQEINKAFPLSIPYLYTEKFEFTIQELSDLHYIYEQLAVNPLYKSIIGLLDKFNDCIHHAEEAAIKNQTAAPRVRFRVVDSKTRVPNFPKVPFKKEDYKLYDPYIEPYIVYLNYNALGEDFLKTFKSGRPVSTAVPLSEYSPSFFFVLQSDYVEKQHREITNCIQWMQNSNIDVTDPVNSLGHIPLGRLHKVYPEDFLKVILQRELTKVEIEEL